LRSRLARRPVTSLASHIHEPEQCRREWEDPQRPECPRAAGAHTKARNNHASFDPHRDSRVGAGDSSDAHTVYVDTGTEKMTHVAVD
jgi:Cu/Zn superoxide dismutase